MRAATACASDPAQARRGRLCSSPTICRGWTDYRGLWGLDTEDPFGGERALRDPKYNRNGSIRKSWYDPLGWAGLDKVTPPEELVPELEDQIETLRSRGQELEAEIRRQREKLRRHTLGGAGADGERVRLRHRGEQRKKRDAEEDALNDLYAERITVLETRRAAEAYLERVRRGDLGDPQAHLRNQHMPAPPVTHLTRGDRVLVRDQRRAASCCWWPGWCILRPPHWPWWLIMVGFGFFALEATARGYLSSYLLNVSVLLAIVSSVLLLFKFWWLAILVGHRGAGVVHDPREPARDAFQRANDRRRLRQRSPQRTQMLQRMAENREQLKKARRGETVDHSSVGFAVTRIARSNCCISLQALGGRTGANTHRNERRRGIKPTCNFVLCAESLC